MEELKQALGQLYEEFGHNVITIRLSEILDEIIVKEQRKKLESIRGGRFGMFDTITVKSVNENLETISGPIILKKHKIDNIKLFSIIEGKVKKERWEAVMLVNECIRHTMHHEKLLNKTKDEMTEEEQFFVREDFYKKYLCELEEQKATRLINLIDVMVSNDELRNFGGK